MDSEYYSSDEDDEMEIPIDLIPREVERLYESACNRGTLDVMKNQILSLLNIYKIDIKITDYQNELMDIYEDVIQNYLDYQCPEKVLDANSHDLKQKFIQWALTNTEKGIELDYLDSIYIQLTNYD